jgi:hypothetical protein
LTANGLPPQRCRSTPSPLTRRPPPQLPSDLHHLHLPRRHQRRQQVTKYLGRAPGSLLKFRRGHARLPGAGDGDGGGHGIGDFFGEAVFDPGSEGLHGSRYYGRREIPFGLTDNSGGQDNPFTLLF